MTSIVKAKVIIVGDGACGKTSVALRLTDGHYNSDYIPTVFENSVHTFDIDNTFLEMALWDTAGQEDYARLITLAYPNSDLLIICFSISEKTTFENVKERWMIEAKTNCEGVPIILIGNKLDLRGPGTITKEQGEELAKEINAIKYYECSAKDNVGIKEAFQDMAQLLVKMKANKKNKKRFLCC